MKAGIVTLWGLNNYGNRLQNYAVFSSLHRLGVDAETVVPRQWAKTAYRVRTEVQVREQMKRDELAAQQTNPLVVRQFRFEEFNARFIPERHVDAVRFDGKLARQYDYWVTGSDQVWNPSFRDSLGQLDNRLLAFAAPQQRVCFAPSIGMDELDAKWHELFRREWVKFPNLNVREQSGRDIIQQLTGRDAEVVLDPTFMIDKGEWTELARPVPGFDYDKPYVLYYFLGKEDEEVPAQVRTAITKQIRKRKLAEYRFFSNEDLALRSAGPSELLSVFQHAQLIVTDSFHGTVFSILMGKPFLLCDRKLVINDAEIDMSNRTVSLLNKLGLRQRLPENQSLAEADIWECDYLRTYGIIRREQNRMGNLLRQAMHMGERG